MAEVNADYICKNNIKEILEKMYNNKKCSNASFLVNKKQFHVLSQIVTASSEVLSSLMCSHFANCTDKKVKIVDVKKVESFEIVLKFMYGVDINFTQTDIGVLCEALSLSETYKIFALSKELSCYLSTLDCFQVNFVVPLLNSAKKANLQDLYEKLSIFVYENTDAIVKHPSFIDLQYDVLLDLVASDWFFTSEIDILIGVLNWHSDMYKSGKETRVKEKQSEDVSEEQDVSSDNQSDASDCETELTESVDILSLDDDDGKMEDLNQTSHLESKVNAEEDRKIKQQSDLVQSFCENILKSLLSHIRVKQFSAFEFMKAVESELFQKYKVYIADYKYFSESNEPRKRYVRANGDNVEEVEEEPVVIPRPVVVNYIPKCNITKTFTIIWTGEHNTLYESEEDYLVDDLKLKLCLERNIAIYAPGSYLNNPYSTYSNKLSLIFDQISTGNWECTVECKITWNSGDPNIFKSLVSPNPSNGVTYKNCTLTPHNPIANIATFHLDDCNHPTWYLTLQPNNILTFTIYFKSIHRKNVE